MTFLKQNWFKLSILGLVALCILTYRFEFFRLEDDVVGKCNKFTGTCERDYVGPSIF